jgi:hypothetical protein
MTKFSNAVKFDLVIIGRRPTVTRGMDLIWMDLIFVFGSIRHYRRATEKNQGNLRSG